jgi:hypothetical protein
MVGQIPQRYAGLEIQRAQDITLSHVMAGCLVSATASLKRERIASGRGRMAVSGSGAVNSPFLVYIFGLLRPGI